MPIHRRSHVAAAVAVVVASLSPLALHAQNTTDPAKPQRVEITGSNIKRIDAETSSPVQVMKREEIKRTGATTVREALETLVASNNTALSDISGSNSFAGGASSVDLRGLGKQATLVLLNSRRVSPYALADFNEVFANLDALPLDAVDRIEVLKNGASAIYGSDAVAGVINIITRKDYQGFTVGGDYQRSLYSNKFGEGTIHATGGIGDYDRDGYNLLANVEFFKRDHVMWRDVLSRANSETLAALPKGAAQLSSYSFPGNVAGAPVPGCAVVVGGLCRFDRYSRFEAQPEADRANLLLSGRLKVSEDIEGFAEVLYSHTKTRYLNAFIPYGEGLGPDAWYDISSGKLKYFYHRGLPAGHPLNPTGDEAALRYRFADTAADAEFSSDNYRALAGLRGTYKGFDWETALAVLGAGTDQKERGRLSDSGFKQVIGDYKTPDQPLDPDFFNKPGGYQLGGPNSQTVLDTLYPTYGNKGKTRQVALDAKVSGEIAKLPAGPLGLALGFDLRHENFSITPTSNLTNGDIVGLGISTTDASRNFGAIFAELNVPVTSQLESQLAARVDKFPNFGAHISPKVGVRYQPMRELMLRGTYEGGFRAPNLTEAAPSLKSSFDNGIVDPKRCSQASALATDLRTQAEPLLDTDPNKALLLARADTIEQNECSASVGNLTRNNPNLKPEVSRSYSLGLVLEPVKDLSASLDYWHIVRTNEIGLRTTRELLANEGALPPGISVTRDVLDANDRSFTTAEQGTYGVTTGALNAVTNFFENVAKTKTSGLDIGFASAWRLPIGKVDVGFQGTYLLGYYKYSPAINGYGDNLAGRYDPSGSTHPRFVASLSGSLTTGPFVNSLRLAYQSAVSLHDDYFDTDFTPEGCADKHITNCRVAPYQRLDYFLSYTGVKNLTLSMYVRNLFNRKPPFDARRLYLSGSNTIPQDVEDVQRRTLKLALDYKFF